MEDLMENLLDLSNVLGIPAVETIRRSIKSWVGGLPAMPPHVPASGVSGESGSDSLAGIVVGAFTVFDGDHKSSIFSTKFGK